jgi:hypothetical protein
MGRVLDPARGREEDRGEGDVSTIGYHPSPSSPPSPARGEGVVTQSVSFRGTEHWLSSVAVQVYLSGDIRCHSKFAVLNREL